MQNFYPIGNWVKRIRNKAWLNKLVTKSQKEQK